MAQWVKALCIRVLAKVSAAPVLFWVPANAPEKQQMVTQVPETLPPKCKTRKAFLTPVFRVTQSQC